MSLLTPERYFARISRISIAKDICALGFTHVLLDVDNTVLSRQSHDVPRDVRLWLSQARNAGLSLCLVSNNWHSNVHSIADELSIPIVGKALKPLPHGFMAARGKIGARSATTLVIGDQIATDILGAHMLGMKAYLVCPLVEQDLWHTQMLRSLEHTMLGERTPEGALSAGDNAVRSEDIH